MTSKTAIHELRRMEAAGLRPTWEDAIRLNALGLRLEAIRAEKAARHILPRLAVISDSVAFREPTVGHEMWLAKAERLIDDDPQSSLALNCYALSRDWTELPDPCVPAKVKSAVEAYLPELKPYMRVQLEAAVNYAIHGYEPSAGEVYAAKSGEADLDECVAAGILDQGRAVLFGHSVADMKSMTLKELVETIQSAYALHGREAGGDFSVHQGRFFATVAEIESRLKSEGVKNG